MRGRTYTIGVLLDNVRNAFFADILDGIRNELRHTDYTVLIGAAGFDPDEQARTIRSLVDRQMDGLILIAPGTPRAEVLATAASTPTVVIGHHDASDTYDSVVDADDLSARAWWWITSSRSATATSPWSRPRAPGPTSGSARRKPC
ncbi:HTH-type transcriptional repressor PurR [Streptomyces alboniger]